MPVRWIDFLSREYHHIKIHGDEGEKYEPAMVIMDHNHPGKSFQILLPVMWKYVDPHDNKDAAPADREEYQKIKDLIVFQKSMAVYDYQHAAVNADLACCFMAEMFIGHRHSR